MANLEMTPGQLEQLADMIAERVANQPRLLDRFQLAEKIGLSVSTIERLMAKGKLPYVKANRRVVFDLEAVVAALSEISKNGQ